MAVSRGTTEASLLQGILEEPEDDACRLVYADWLEEHGHDERAEFIRVQCSLARIEGDDPRRFALAQRQIELVPRQGPAIAAGLSKAVRENFQWTLSRGFIDEVRTTATHFLKGAGGLLRLHPLRLAELRSIDAARLAACSSLRRLSGLSVSNLNTAGLETLAASPHLMGVKELRVYWPVDCTAGRLLQMLKAPAFAGLAGLTVCGLAGDNCMAHLADAPACARLTALSFAGRFGPGDVRALAASPNLARLTALKLFNHGEHGGGFGILPALAASPYLGGLTSLTIDAGSIPEADVEALAATPHLRNLTDLSLGWAELTPSGWEKLLRSPRLPRLSRLHVHGWDYKVPTALGLKSLPNLNGIMWVWVPR